MFCEICLNTPKNPVNLCADITCQQNGNMHCCPIGIAECVTKWENNILNYDLVFSNNNTVVEKINSTLFCVGVNVRAKLVGVISSITIKITKINLSSGSLMFGLMSSNTRNINKLQGIINYKNDHCFSIINDDGNVIKTIQQLNIGDILQGIVDISKGFFYLIINNILVHTFKIPINIKDFYNFEVMLEGSHELSIITNFS